MLVCKCTLPYTANRTPFPGYNHASNKTIFPKSDVMGATERFTSHRQIFVQAIWSHVSSLLLPDQPSHETGKGRDILLSMVAICSGHRKCPADKGHHMSRPFRPRIIGRLIRLSVATVPLVCHQVQRIAPSPTRRYSRR